jgi:hypothetical protein
MTILKPIMDMTKGFALVGLALMLAGCMGPIARETIRETTNYPHPYYGPDYGRGGHWDHGNHWGGQGKHGDHGRYRH